MPYLLDLKKNFTTVALKYAIGMKSTYAIRIYELLKQYAGIGSRLVSLAELR
ncbi:RepB family plasmid replication initiator protein [Magnetospirillum fulvum]|nr:Initiator Replication protein [Magnetospirillum fulvum]